MSLAIFNRKHSVDSYINQYLEGIIAVLFRLDKNKIAILIEELVQLKKRKGRLFLLGIGGSAANCSHAVNDFRKIAHIEAYTPVDNIAELTARTNDDGWNTIFANWLDDSQLNRKDTVMVFSVSGGDEEKDISTNIVKALEYAEEKGATILGVVSRDGGYTLKSAKVCILIPVISKETITPFAESFQAVIWHLLVNYSKLKE